MAASRIALYRNILQKAPLSNQEHESRLRSFRPISPVKMISNLWAGNQPKQRIDPHVMKAIPSLLPPVSTNRISENANPIVDKPSDNKTTVVDASSANPKDTLALLEATLTTYLVALHSRSGNLVGRVLRGRAGADELAVNELYNILGLLLHLPFVIINRLSLCSSGSF